jgi:hypothetical protein
MHRLQKGFPFNWRRISTDCIAGTQMGQMTGQGRSGIITSLLIFSTRTRQARKANLLGRGL